MAKGKRGSRKDYSTTTSRSDTTTTRDDANIDSNEEMLDETRKASEAKESEGASRTTFKETNADKAIEEQTGTPGQASKQFQKISDAEKNLYEKPLTAGGRPHPVAKPGERQL